ncbi:MAG TPA: 2-amino-4-hydroxy-6-hydroxymethyldihydropteridine diphosphokinase, partial [Ktedonobacteraceae bacterium]|nr:2-amino-4-hydroxy-6-hydroxymethyldihydropteridine diphosphokinase [Ktedonobacteraceae bacterium]
MSIDTRETTASPLFPQDGKVTTATHRVYLALGSNLGDRRSSLAMSLQMLREHLEITEVSSIYETEPVGYLDQPHFLNIVCAGKTRLSAPDLLSSAKEIEQLIGRQPTFRNGPRPIDIDILFYDDVQITQEQLTIPHPRIAERAFVLIPLAEIAPDLIDPITGKRIQTLSGLVSSKGIKRIAASLRIPLEHDIQSGKPTVHVGLGRVGVVGVRKSLLIGDENHSQWFDATFDLYANLNPSQAGAHMSRFSDSL